MARKNILGWRRVIFLLAVVGGGYVYQRYFDQGATAPGAGGPAASGGSPRVEEAPPSGEKLDGSRRIDEAFRGRQSDVEVEATAVVEKILPDDREGDRHQRFIVRLDSGTTILVAHNIDLAARVPAQVGDTLTVRGVYEWNDKGGVIHWTHHNPHGGRRRGWIVHEGKEYK